MPQRRDQSGWLQGRVQFLVRWLDLVALAASTA